MRKNLKKSAEIAELNRAALLARLSAAALNPGTPWRD